MSDAGMAFLEKCMQEEDSWSKTIKLWKETAEMEYACCQIMLVM